MTHPATQTKPRRSEGVEIEELCPACHGNGCWDCDYTGTPRTPEQDPWVLFAAEEDEVAA